MKILIISTTYPPYISGVATATSNLANQLSQKHQVAIISANTSITTKKTQINSNLIHFSLPGIKFHPDKDFPIPYPRPKAIKQIINQYKPQIIHLQDPSPFSLSAQKQAKLLNIPIIATHHFTAEMILKWLIPSNKLSQRLAQSNTTKYLIYRLVTIFYNRCDLITVPNPSLIPYFKQAKLTKPIISIPNSIKINRFIRKRKNKRIFKKYSIKAKSIILYVGRLDIDKNINMLIQAFSGIHQQNPHTHLVIVGHGTQKSNLVKLTSKLKLNHAVHFLGKIPNHNPVLAEIYNAADIFANPSIIENQAVAFIEAMAAKLPIVASNTDITQGFIKHNRNCLLFAPNNPMALTASLQKLLSDTKLANKISRRNFKAVKKYDSAKVSKKYIKAYRSILK